MDTSYKEFTYRKPIPSDAPRLATLLKAVYIHTYALEGVTTEFVEFTNEQFSEENLIKMMDSKEADFLVALYKENPIGIVKIEYNKTTPIENITATKLDKLYVLNHFHGKGIGFQLHTKIEAIAKAKGEKEMWLWVYYKNEQAITFYEKQNYKSIGMADFTVKQNSYPNHILLKQL